MKIVKRVDKFQSRDGLLRFYGVAWQEDYGHTTVLFPIPLNFLLGWLREFYLNLSSGPKMPKKRYEEIQAAYHAGYKQGEKDALLTLNRTFESTSTTIKEDPYE